MGRLCNSSVRLNFSAIAIALLLFSLASVATAQIDTGAIVGTVRDPSAAVVPNATVTLTNTATGAKQNGVTNSAGEYEFTALRPGTYNVHVSASGFGSQVRNNI